MSRHEDVVRLAHMLDHAREAVAMAVGCSLDDLPQNRMLNLALVRLVEIVGEAASRVSDARRSLHPEIPWAEIRGMRNRIVHGYDSINFRILWDVITLDLPPLIATLERILGSDASPS